MQAEYGSTLYLPSGDRSVQLEYQRLIYKMMLEQGDYNYSEPDDRLKKVYCLFILETLLSQESVNSIESSAEFRDSKQDLYKPTLFANAFGVIDGFVTSGRSGSNSLPPLP